MDITECDGAGEKATEGPLVSPQTVKAFGAHRYASLCASCRESPWEEGLELFGRGAFSLCLPVESTISC